MASSHVHFGLVEGFDLLVINQRTMWHLYIELRGHGHRSTRIFESARTAKQKLKVKTEVEESLQGNLDRTSVRETIKFGFERLASIFVREWGRSHAYRANT